MKEKRRQKNNRIQKKFLKKNMASPAKWQNDRIKVRFSGIHMTVYKARYYQYFFGSGWGAAFSLTSPNSR